MNQKSSCFLILFCLFFLKMGAQDIQEAISKNSYSNTTLADYKTVLKYDPSALLNPSTPTFQFGIQQQVSPKIHLEFSAGYATTFGGRWVKSVPLSGYLLRLEGMLAVYQRDSKAMFLGLQGIYKNFEEMPTEQFSRFNNAYQQFITYNSKKEQIAVHFLFLFQKKVGDRWLIEFAAGQGVRSNYRKDSGIPDDAVSLEEESVFDFDQVGRDTYPSLHLRLGVGVNISGK